LETLSEMELLAVADTLVPREHSNEEIICEEGKLGDQFYLIEVSLSVSLSISLSLSHSPFPTALLTTPRSQEGEVICTQKDPSSGSENVIATLSKGNYFGEVALLTDKPRQATVRVAPHQTIRLLSLDRATFKRLFGPLDPILRRNMDSYNRFLARNI
jgi:CRP-like cAMP-binding protein